VALLLPEQPDQCILCIWDAVDARRLETLTIPMPQREALPFITTEMLAVMKDQPTCTLECWCWTTEQKTDNVDATLEPFDVSPVKRTDALHIRHGYLRVKHPKAMMMRPGVARDWPYLLCLLGLHSDYRRAHLELYDVRDLKPEQTLGWTHCINLPLVQNEGVDAAQLEVVNNFSPDCILVAGYIRIIVPQSGIYKKTIISILARWKPGQKQISWVRRQWPGNAKVSHVQAAPHYHRILVMLQNKPALILDTETGNTLHTLNFLFGGDHIYQVIGPNFTFASNRTARIGVVDIVRGKMTWCEKVDHKDHCNIHQLYASPICGYIVYHTLETVRLLRLDVLRDGSFFKSIVQAT
jgi:hypothetical protein